MFYAMFKRLFVFEMGLYKLMWSSVLQADENTWGLSYQSNKLGLFFSQLSELQQKHMTLCQLRPSYLQDKVGQSQP